MQTRSMPLTLSKGEIGHIPIKCSIWYAETSCRYRYNAVMTVQVIVEKVTARVLARIEEGASRVRVGDGRVAEDR